MTKANVKYTKMENDDARKWLEVLLKPHDYDKHSLDELLLVQYWAQKYEDYWFTRKSARYWVHGDGELLIAAEPNVKLEGYGLRGVYSTYQRKQFNLERYIHGGSSGWTEMEGLLSYLKRRKERGEDTVFQEQVDECVRRLKLNYEKNTLRVLQRFTEENVTEEYIRTRLRKHLVSMSQGSGNGFSTSWVDYTMFLERIEPKPHYPSVPILKPKPVMSGFAIEEYMKNALNFNRLKRDGFTSRAISFAIPKVISHHWDATRNAIRLAETAARSWCAVWTELIGDEEE